MQRVKQTLLACVVVSTGFSLIAQNLSDSQLEEARRLLWESNETLQPTETTVPVTASPTMSDEQIENARNLLWQGVEAPDDGPVPEAEAPVVDTIEIMEEPAEPAPSMEIVEVPVTLTPERLENARAILDRDMNRANNMETPPPLNLTTVTFQEGSSVEDNLRQLNQLYVNGMISPELYHKKRAELAAQR